MVDVIREEHNHPNQREIRVSGRRNKNGIKVKKMINLSFAPLTTQASHPISRTQASRNLNWKDFNSSDALYKSLVPGYNRCGTKNNKRKLNPKINKGIKTTNTGVMSSSFPPGMEET